MKSVSLVWVVFFALATTALFAQNSVKTRETVQIGGIPQWIEAKSKDDSKPLLLFLHGGPGISFQADSRKFVKHLVKDFIVVQWDQRESGMTAILGPFNDSLTLELFQSDTEEVVSYLLKKFSKKKLFLAGFSWGGFLGLHFANQHPELLHGYISVSGMIYGYESEKLTLTVLKKKVNDSNNKEALKEISQIKLPFNSWEELYYQRKWTAYFFDKEKYSEITKKLSHRYLAKWMSISQEAAKVNYLEVAPEIKCPIYFFISKNDFVCNYRVTEKYYTKLKADIKRIVWFERSTHAIPIQEPKKFSAELIKITNQINFES